MSDFNFSNVSAREVVPSQIGTYTIVELDGAPKLLGVCAGEKNKSLRAAVNKANAQRGARATRNADAVNMQARAIVRAQFPKHVIKGWEDVIDADGEPVVFSPEACDAFLRALPDWILQGVIEYFADPENFAGVGVTAGEIGEVSGN
ncbi:MAG: hypothetical protein DRJ50_02770 [Actinobacteria bacterium]|nr:MAG: hypothetical protein DRJ50_02770 [Actinomycetota bacterium]